MAPYFIPKFQQEVAHFKHNYFFTLQLHVHVLSLMSFKDKKTLFLKVCLLISSGKKKQNQ